MSHKGRVLVQDSTWIVQTHASLMLLISTGYIDVFWSSIGFSSLWADGVGAALVSVAADGVGILIYRRWF